MNPSRPDADAGDPSAPHWTVGAVARRLGVSPATLRSWGHRYGIGPTGHRAGRYRRYSAADVAELATMRRLTSQGMPMATAVALARSQHRGAHTGAAPGAAAGRAPAPPAGAGGRADASPTHVDEFVRAARELDEDTLSSMLEHSLDTRGVAATWDSLCRPALVGLVAESESWSDCIDAECTLAWTISTSLRRLPVLPPAGEGARHVVVGCAPGEQHTLASEALLAALREQHVPARTLGPAVPDEAWMLVAERTCPAAVFVWSHSSRTARPGVLRRLLEHTGTVVAAGPGWERRSLPAAVLTASSLGEAVGTARRAVDEAGRRS